MDEHNVCDIDTHGLIQLEFHLSFLQPVLISNGGHTYVVSPTYVHNILMDNNGIM